MGPTCPLNGCSNRVIRMKILKSFTIDFRQKQSREAVVPRTRTCEVQNVLYPPIVEIPKAACLT